MKYERINKNYTKIIISFIVIIIIGSVLVLNITKAKYRKTISIPIVSGTINYSSGYDFKIMALYQQKDDKICTYDECYDSIDRMPSSEYVINTDKSYCSISGSEKDDQAKLYTERGKHIIENLAKNEKCYLYFDTTGSIKTLKNLGLGSNGEVTDFSKTACSNGCGTTTENGVYEAEDDFGTSYYFRGSVDNNWVKFGKTGTQSGSGNDIWWRILRINGDGSIRLLYAGNGSSGTSLSESDGRIRATNYKFNTSINDNRFVGYQYGDSGVKRGNTIPSNAYTLLKDWFYKNLSDEFSASNSKMDKNAGFCGDRSSSSEYSTPWSETMRESGGTGTDKTYYGAYLRLIIKKEPTLKCGINNNKDDDYYTYTGAKETDASDGTRIKGTQSLDYPIGLITADELVFAGGVYNSANSKYWLYTGQQYWTMSPSSYSMADLIYMYSNGGFSHTGVYTEFGLRPVINLKADIKFTFEKEDELKGTITNPYIVS